MKEMKEMMNHNASYTALYKEVLEHMFSLNSFFWVTI